jgi:hypothetical protein
MAGLVSVTALRSSTTGRPTKKPADERIQLSSSASQSTMGGSGVSAKAM